MGVFTIARPSLSFTEHFPVKVGEFVCEWSYLMEQALLQKIQDNPAECMRIFTETVVKLCTEQVTKVSASVRKLDLSSVFNREVWCTLVSNVSMINLCVQGLGIDMHTFEEQFKSGDLELRTYFEIPESVYSCIALTDQKICEYVDCFYLGLINTPMKAPNADLLIYSGTNAATYLEIMLLPLRLLQLIRPGSYDKVKAIISDFMKVRLTREAVMNSEPIPTQRDIVHCERDPGSKYMWLFEQGLRAISLCPISLPKNYSLLLRAMMTLSGAYFFVQSVPKEKDREMKRRADTQAEATVMRLQTLRFELRLMTHLHMCLRGGRKLVSTSNLFDTAIRPADDLMKTMGVATPEAMGVFWEKFVMYIGEYPLTDGQAERFRRRLFSIIMGPGSRKAGMMLQPARLDHVILQAEETAHPLDFLNSIFCTSPNMGAPDLISTYTDLRALSRYMREGMVGHEGDREEYLKIRKVVYDPVIAAHKDHIPLRKFCEWSPDDLVPDSIFHRRAVIVAILCFIDARFENYGMPNHLDLHFMAIPIDERPLESVASILHWGGEMSMVSHLGHNVRVEDQDPRLFLCLYLGIMKSWVANTHVNSFIRSFVALLHTQQL